MFEAKGFLKYLSPDEQKSEMEMKAFKQDMVEKLRQQLMEDRRKMSEAQKEWRNQQMAALQAQVVKNNRREYRLWKNC